MKWLFPLFILSFLINSSPCKALPTIESEPTVAICSSLSASPIIKPADGQGRVIVGTISVCAGVGLLVAGSVVRYSSSKSNAINTGKSMQGIGLCFIGLPLGIYVTSDGRIKGSRSNRKPRGFKNRHHYY